MKRFSLALLCSLPFLFAGCSSMSGSTPQEIVASLAAANAGCTRLTLHCMQDGAATCCASTDQARVGKASDAEDVQAMNTGETIVKDENGGVDVTVPILMTDGKWTTVCGVTMAPSSCHRG